MTDSNKKVDLRECEVASLGDKEYVKSLIPVFHHCTFICGPLVAVTIVPPGY
ncbi:MAG: hypothetical protein IT427_15235 [Pirellulales bacterium]|nr:hypothetical protein [Pirellulales bacterium]